MDMMIDQTVFASDEGCYLMGNSPWRTTSNNLLTRGMTFKSLTNFKGRSGKSLMLVRLVIWAASSVSSQYGAACHFGWNPANIQRWNQQRHCVQRCTKLILGIQNSAYVIVIPAIFAHLRELLRVDEIPNHRTAEHPYLHLLQRTGKFRWQHCLLVILPWNWGLQEWRSDWCYDALPGKFLCLISFIHNHWTHICFSVTVKLKIREILCPYANWMQRNRQLCWSKMFYLVLGKRLAWMNGLQ